MSKPENSTLLNICIIPEERVGASCASISRSLKTGTPLFRLGGDKIAHITVYMARFADDKIEAAINAAHDPIQATKPFECEHAGYFMTAGNYLEASYRKSQALMQLHAALIRAVAPLRLNPGEPYEEGYFAPYTKRQQKNAQDTGYDLAFSLYRPHITLARYAENDLPVAFPAIPESRLSFTLSKVCIYKADDNGAVYELLQQFMI
jgi:2'-5' RNA ligase